jgi:hypothetical protein
MLECGAVSGSDAVHGVPVRTISRKPVRASSIEDRPARGKLRSCKGKYLFCIVRVKIQAGGGKAVANPVKIRRAD